MASFHPPSICSNPPFCRHNELITFKHPQVRCQGSPEDGTSANIVDANLGILRGRVSEVKMKEKLETWSRLKNGWNYETGYDHKYRRDGVLSKSLELMGFASGALGCSFCLDLFSSIREDFVPPNVSSLSN